MLRFDFFQNERRRAPFLVAAMAYYEKALPQSSKRTLLVGPRGNTGAVAQAIACSG